MITTKRSDNGMSAFTADSSRGGVALLERKQPVSYNEYAAPETTGENVDEARARMQENLAKLLNYDRYSEQVNAVAVVEETEPVVQTQTSAVVSDFAENSTMAISEDDIRPTSTTMQFGDGDIENLRMDMKKEEESTGKYRLNAKGKIVVVLYALVLTVVLALIAINTGVLATLTNKEQTAIATTQARIQTLSEVEMKIEDISSNEYISQQAEGLGMIK